jgi:predicted transglutaminase-like cysteine proteinase
MDMKQNNAKKRLLTAAMAFGLVVIPYQTANAGNRNIMRIGQFTSQPIGHYDYCRTQLADCSIKSNNTNPVKLNKARWSEMVNANARANNTVIPVTDQEYYGTEELWALPNAYGDCEDFALMKRKELMSKGWPASSLLVTVVRQRNGEGHAVLTVRTDKADFILDNLNTEIRVWNKTEYTYLKRQAASHSGRWEDIVDSRNMVGSVN